MPGILLDQHKVSLPHVRGNLLTQQQVPSGLSQRQKFGLSLRLAEVFVLPGLYHHVREREHITLASTRTRQPLLSVTDNTTIEEVLRHLAAMGVMDLEVREAHHYALSWLSHMANSSNPRLEEPEAASAVLNRLRQSLCGPEDSPLITKPHWWTPSSTKISYSNPRPKRKREPTAPTRSSPPSNPAGAPAGPSSHPPGAAWGFSAYARSSN